MSRRDPGAAERRLLGDLKRAQRERDVALALVARQAEVIAEANDRELRAALAPVLHDFDDFVRHVGVENIVDCDGRILWHEVELRLEVLRWQRPHLFVSLAARVGAQS